ncbi:hypothetical protein V6K52_19480 [Knoellia sp. S7-12]|uniref:hypothetical protein n=1 Tax=Knoellia sp. S7-12 TaxID=3126698 RepID=UPI0033671225
MAFIIRALGIGLAATAAYLLMTIGDDGEGGANIGAGLAVFAVLAVGGFVWALLDGLARPSAAAQPIGLGALLLRWVLASVMAVAVVIAAMEVRSGGDYLSDFDASSAVFLVLLVLVPSVVGALIGYAARGTGSVAPSHTRSS